MTVPTLCTSCGEHRAMHTIYRGDETARLCCYCNVRQTGVPSDWHPGCMAAAASATEADR